MEARQPSDSSLSELEIVVFSGMGVVVIWGWFMNRWIHRYNNHVLISVLMWCLLSTEVVILLIA